MDITEKDSPCLDVIIVGAGISGINAAYRIQSSLPQSQYLILENRSSIGGTWDLFKYPGIRSDSALWTFGFPWRAWTSDHGIADGASILEYIRASAQETGIDTHIRFNHNLLRANWSSSSQSWRLEVRVSAEKTVYYHTRFLMLCTGYYDYAHPLSTTIPGLSNFSGPVLHPQFWPADEPTPSYAGKRVAVIGSGATAITLVPSLAKHAAHVTMIQRSPSYIASSASKDPTVQKLKRWLPTWLAFRVMRVRSLIMGTLFNKFCAAYPERARAMLRKATMKHLGGKIPHDPHFRPRYNPWEQRLCLCPDGDFYRVLREGKAEVVTGTIMNIGEREVEMTDGTRVEADVIVTATGLKLLIGGGTEISVDNEPVAINERFLWKATMMQDVPNLGLVLGYTNASWTLGADAAAWMVVRVLKYMQGRGLTSATPRITEEMEEKPFLNLSSTYVTRGRQAMPKAGAKAPWMPRSSYLWDLWDAKWGNVTKGMEFAKVSV